MEHKDLLELLELSDKQFRKIPALKGYEGESLADLAFRMRDEVCHDLTGLVFWTEAQVIVTKYLGKIPESWDVWSKPQHWIVRALVARRIAKLKPL